MIPLVVLLVVDDLQSFFYGCRLLPVFGRLEQISSLKACCCCSEKKKKIKSPNTEDEPKSIQSSAIPPNAADAGHAANADAATGTDAPRAAAKRGH